MKAERQFLHDISSPLAVTTIKLEMILKRLQAGKADDPKIAEDLQKALNAAKEVVTMITDRKAEL